MTTNPGPHGSRMNTLRYPNTALPGEPPIYNGVCSAMSRTSVGDPIYCDQGNHPHHMHLAELGQGISCSWYSPSEIDPTMPDLMDPPEDVA